MATTTSTTTAARKLAALLEGFERRRPMRAGSLIVTIYGDAVVPRGGSLWLGSLLDMMAGFGVEPGLVRTAVSRLVADGWFERTRLGKQSYYRLSPWGAAEFAAATRHIYRAAEPAWSGEMEIAVLTMTDASARAARRERMLRAGYGQAAANVMVRPHMEPMEPMEPNGGSARGARRNVPSLAGEGQEGASTETVVMVTRPQSAGNARALAKACWQLDALDAAYRGFLEAFGPVADEIADGARLADAQAFQLRTLLIHDWRRIVLRDPLLPHAMLTEDWPGIGALDLVSRVYRRILPGAERWLDRHAINENGPLPPACNALAERFRAA